MFAIYRLFSQLSWNAKQ